VLNELLKDHQEPEDLLGQNGLPKQWQKRLLEKTIGAELTVHLGYGKHDWAGRNSGNSRNGSSPKRGWRVRAKRSSWKRAQGRAAEGKAPSSTSA
jgi:dienelactone hydrolase